MQRGGKVSLKSMAGKMCRDGGEREGGGEGGGDGGGEGEDEEREARG